MIEKNTMFSVNRLSNDDIREIVAEINETDCRTDGSPITNYEQARELLEAKPEMAVSHNTAIAYLVHDVFYK